MDNEIEYVHTRYAHSEKITRDFVTILFAFSFLKSMPLKAKLGWKSIQETVRFCLKIFKNSLTWNWKSENGKMYNPVNKIGLFLWKHGVPYPNPLYQLFPPPFGKNHILFMESMFEILNNMDMPKSDWELLLNWVELVGKDDEQKKKYNDAIDRASAALWKAFNAEKYHRYVVADVEGN
jgi:hypothetical protein